MPEDGKTIFKNAIVLTIADFFCLIMSFVLMIFVGRKLGPELLGVYAFGNAIINIFIILCTFGLEPYIQREVSRSPEISGYLMAQIFVFKLLLYAVAVIIIGIFSIVAIDDELKRTVLWLLTGTMFFKINFMALCSFFLAHQKAIYEAAVGITLRLVYTSSGIIAMLTGKGLLTLVSLELIASVISFFIAWGLFITKIDTPFHRIRLSTIVKLIKNTWEFMVLQLVQRLFLRVDMLMLSMMTSDIATGFYSVTVRLTAAFAFIPSSLTGAFFPSLSRSAMVNTDEFVKLFKPYLRFLLLIGSGICAVLAGLSSEFIVLIFGEAFYPAGPTLALLAAVLVLDYASWPFSMSIIALDRERQSIMIFFFSAMSNIIANIIMIPLWQEQGAAISTIISFVVLILLQCRAIGYDMIKRFALFQLSFGPIMTGCLTWCTILICNSYHLGLILILTIATFSYALFAILTKSVKAEDMVMLKQFLTKKQ